MARIPKHEKRVRVKVKSLEELEWVYKEAGIIAMCRVGDSIIVYGDDEGEVDKAIELIRKWGEKHGRV